MAGKPPASAGRPFDDRSLSGLASASRRLGEPLRREISGHLPPEPGGARSFGVKRNAEIVMVLPRPDGVLVHTKAFYPRGVLRLPTGGIREREPILKAARREALEETGIALRPSRFLFHLVQQVDHGDTLRPFHSLAFLYPSSSGPVVPEDDSEQITEMRPVAWEALDAVAGSLEALEDDWQAWGAFRAAPHRLLLEVRRTRPEWFDEA